MQFNKYYLLNIYLINISSAPYIMIPLVTCPYLPKYRIVHSEYVYNHKNTLITIPKDFIYDGASIPKILWSITTAPFTSSVDNAACVHDYIYSKECTLDIDRKAADTILYDILLENGIDKVRATLAFFVVRIFGQFSWKIAKNYTADKNE